MIRFRSFYKEPKEGEEAFSIVAYAKIPYSVTTKECEYDPCFTSTQTHYVFVNQYRKWLMIDLWLFVLKFNWFTKYKD